MEKENIDYYFKFALDLVKNAGKIVKEAKDLKIETKVAAWDLVTEYDRKIEESIIATLKTEFPTHKFIGEEGSAENNRIPELTNDPTWIIDPIDGTTNFVHTFPFSCISVALTIDKESVIGITYNPNLEQLFTAQKGKGTFLNGERIYASKVDDVALSMIGFEISIARNEVWRDIFMERLRSLVSIAHAIRSMGSACLGLAYVASGYLDVYQCDGLYPWDAAAGLLLIREAGGYMCDTNGSEFDLMNPNFCAAGTKKLAETVVDMIKEADLTVNQKKKEL